MDAEQRAVKEQPVGLQAGGPGGTGSCFSASPSGHWRVPTCLEPGIKLAAGNRSVSETDPVPAVVGITVLEGHDPNIICKLGEWQLGSGLPY